VAERVYDPPSGELWWLVVESEGIALEQGPTRWGSEPDRSADRDPNPRATGHMETRPSAESTSRRRIDVHRRYRHSVDAKGRVAIPIRFPCASGEGAMLAAGSTGCAAIFRDRHSRSSPRRSRTADLGRARQGLLSVPVLRFLRGRNRPAGPDPAAAAIKEWSGVGADAVVVGARDHVEIWDPGRVGEVAAGRQLGRRSRLAPDRARHLAMNDNFRDPLGPARDGESVEGSPEGGAEREVGHLPVMVDEGN